MKHIPTLIACMTIAFIPFSSCNASEAAKNPAGFEIHCGTNVSHWLSQDFGWTKREYFITENDIRYISQCGFDHIRLPIDEKEMWSDDGKPVEQSFAQLREAIGWCAKYHLRAIVDLHTVRSHHFNAVNDGTVNTLWNDSREQERFVGLWMQLSARLRDFPNDLAAYEIMNEPTADDPEDWNKLVAVAYKAIRSVEPGRVVVIGADKWQIPQMVPALKVPEGDKNIIISFHTYSPLALTHHRADWIGEPMRSYTGPVNYPGPTIDKENYDRLFAMFKGTPDGGFTNSRDNWNADRIRQEIEPALKRARELGLQLYCGEFGCLPTIPREMRMAYYRDIVGVYESEGVAYANWEYKGDFGIFEWHADKDRIFIGAPDDELTGILTGKSR